MLKKLFTILIILTYLIFPPPANAQEISACRIQVVKSLECVMGTADSPCPSGYFKQFSDLTSTNLPTYLLIDEVQQLARDARLELNGICQQVGSFESIDPFYVAAYGLNSCKAITASSQDAGQSVEISNFCQTKADEYLESFLDGLRSYLIKQAIRTSVEPMVQRMRSLNARLTVLLSEYSRVVSNFYTFDFRLGDTITGERD